MASSSSPSSFSSSSSRQQKKGSSEDESQLVTIPNHGEICDIGCNLAHRSYHKNWKEVLERAASVGVKRVILTGTSLRSSEEVLRLAKQMPKALFSTVGVHPHDAKTCNEDTIARLEKLSMDSAVVAIGETGLDYNRNFSPPEVQRRWFEEQVKLACKLQKPMFLHEREAHEDFVAILSKFSNLPPVVVHCFTGTKEEIERYVSLGYYIGVTGFIAKPSRGAYLKELLSIVPSDKIMIETDAPFMMPNDKRCRNLGSTNEPCTLPIILEHIAACYSVSFEKMAAITLQNTIKFFRLP